ncbi:Aste57867_12284 [Aphanomyces stellatus]|uniref:Aste57867_12284 protein n=1 Tax=Aphanomyces stellatus TaxID=120398 RepID=A0A485KV55_9STRA|nr:hypothetical protein As57867_012239 [Aphanomyces stellatus]VFT89137.1 Aste57867_12284 [Aphanomyces stellatus]
MTKHVSFAATTTLLEFEIGHNPTTVPHVGPGVGLRGRRAFKVSVVPTEASALRRTKRALYMDPVRRVVLLRREGFSMQEITQFCLDADRVKLERRDTVLDYVIEKRQLAARAKLTTTDTSNAIMTRPPSPTGTPVLQLA